MSQRHSRVVLVATATAAVVLSLSGCSLFSHPAPTPSASATASTPSTPSQTPSSTPSATPTPTATSPASAGGCAATSAQMPADAVTHKTIDVDGDGIADTEWISESPTLEFGVTTASGATYSYPLATASPAAREGFIARLNDHRIVSMVDDNRSVYVHFFVNCAWVETKNSHGLQYPLDFNDYTGTGSGVGCSFGYVESYQATSTATGWTVKETPLNLNATGSIANPGVMTTVVANASASDPRVKAAKTISCVSVTIASGGVTLAG